MKSIKYFSIIAFATALFIACEEQPKFSFGLDDSTPPGKPTLLDVRPGYGSACIYFAPPTDKDLLQVVAEYDGPTGEVFKFSASYFKDSINVYGLAKDREYTLRLYALDRANNKSAIVPVKVTPLESSILRVAKTIEVKAGFESFYVQWVNELQQTINLVIDFEFTMGGVPRKIVQVLSSNKSADRQYIRNLKLKSDEPVSMKITVEDIYKNATEPVEFKNVVLLQDSKIPKDDWKLPIPTDSIGGIPQVHGNFADGRMYRVIDDLFDYRNNNNYLNTQEKGRAGNSGLDATGAHASNWNLLIDLGAYYYLSRIVTHQRHSGGTSGQDRGMYYTTTDGSNSTVRGENVGHYAMWYLDEDVDESVKGDWVMNGTEYVRGVWVKISEHKIPIPLNATLVEIITMGQKGDEAYLYPDEPGFTPKSARWFRYEAIAGFQNNYAIVRSGTPHNNCLSEVTLFGKYDRPKK